MSAFWAMTLANVRMVVRNRGALFFLLIFPILFIVLFGYLFSDPGTELTVGVAGAESSRIASTIADQMENTEGFTVHRGSAREEISEIEEGNRTVVVVFSEGTDSAAANAEIYVDETNPSTAQVGISAVEQFLLRAELEMRQQPRMIETEVANVDVDSTRFIDFLIPGILGMSLMMNGILSLSSTFVSFRERGILRRIKGTPFPLWQFILSRITTQVVIAVVQATILLSLGVVLFDFYVSDSYVSLLVMVTLGALAFLSIGFVISAFARNTESADAAANVVFLPMMFLSGVFFPIDDAPGWMQPVTDVMPLTYLVNALRDIILDGASLPDVWFDVLVMLVTAAAGMAVAVRFFRWEPRSM